MDSFKEKKQDKIVGRVAGERVKENLAATKGSRPWGWSIKGLTVTQTADNGGSSSCARAAVESTTDSENQQINRWRVTEMLYFHFQVRVV